MPPGKTCKYEPKTCPRCGAGFECKAGTIVQCQCYGIVLPEQLQLVLEQVYRDCLCRDCLEALLNGAPAENS